MLERLSQPNPDWKSSSMTNVSQRYDISWECDLPYEVRTLKLVTRCVREDDNSLLSGDKSGGVRRFNPSDGTVLWPANGDQSIGSGPVYALTLIHPFDDGERLLDPRCDPCLIAAGTGRGDLVFLDYQSGKPVLVVWEGAEVNRLALGSSILALLYVESLGELWTALSGGVIERLVFSFVQGSVRVASRPPIQIGEAISALSFVPMGAGNSREEYRRGWICAGTVLGNLYRLDHLAKDPEPEELCRRSCAGPVRACLSLSQVMGEYGWRCDVLAVAQGGVVRYLVQESSTAMPDNSIGEPIVVDRPCADRVFCMARVDFGDAVWLTVGTNDRRLRFFRLARHRQPNERSLINFFADRQYSLRLAERTLAVAVRCGGGGGGIDGEEEEGPVHLYVALGDHRLQALRLLPSSEIANRAHSRFGEFHSLADLLAALRQAPHDPGLRREIVALLFRTNWLHDQLDATRWKTSDGRLLRLLIYKLLAGAALSSLREIQSGLVAAARQHPVLRPTASLLVRHIAKYCLDGHSFSDKRRRLDQLAAFNERNGGDYLFDAALYHSLHAERRYSEQELFQLRAPLTSLQRIERPLPWSADSLLVTSYQRGSAWLLAPEGGRSGLELQACEADGSKAKWLQRVVLWEDSSSHKLHALFFYRNLGWTSIDLEGLNAEDDHRELAAPRAVEGCDGPFYIYSHATLPGGLIAVGGRSGDVRLVRISADAGGGRLRVTCWPPRFCAGPHPQYAPVRTLVYRSLGEGRGEVFAGGENGGCYRLAFDGRSLGEPLEVWEGLAPIRVIACHGDNQVIVGDGSGLLLLLRRLYSAVPAPSRLLGEFGVEWAVRLNAGATGIAATSLRIPYPEAGSLRWEDRPIIVVSDSTGVLHILRLDGTREHSFAIRLDSPDPLPVEYLVALSPRADETPPQGPTRLAVACFDETVRILSIIHRREGVRLLNANLACAVIDMLHSEHPELGSHAAELARQVLHNAVASNVPIPDIRSRVLAVLTSTPEGRSITEEDLVGALEEVGWKLASAKIRSESAEVLALRLRFDDVDSFSSLIAHLRILASGSIRTLEGDYPHLQLRYCLRFAFKSLARLLEHKPASDHLAMQLANFVHCCHDLAQNWGPDSSIDNLRCKLAIAHMLFRFASRSSLEWLLGNRLDESLSRIGGRSMTDLFEDRLLNDPRPAVSFRAVQHVRRMVEHDRDQRQMAQPVLDYCVPSLIRRFRQCRTLQEDAWVGMEIYLCVHAIHQCYGYSLWSFVATLLHQGCPPPLLEFLAGRQRVLPPDDSRCLDVVEALRQAAGTSTGERRARAGYRTLFERLADGGRFQQEPQGDLLIALATCLRLLAAVAIAFDPGSDHDVRVQAREEILSTDVWPEAQARSVNAAELRHLLACARLLIRLAEAGPYSDARLLYSELKAEFELLVVADPAAVERTGVPEPDVLRCLFLAARESLRRQMRIEFDFVAPMRFLQQGTSGDEAPAGEPDLVRRLLGFAQLHSELAQAQPALFLRLDPDRQGIVVEIADRRSHQILTTKSEMRRRLAEVLGEDAHFEPLRQEALRLLDPAPPTAEAPLELFDLTAESLGEIIPVHRDDQRYGLLFFAYPRSAAPDPSQRALSRMVPQFLVNQYMRSVQTRRLLSVTFHHISAPVAAMRSILLLMREGLIERSEESQFLEYLWFLVEDCRVMIENHQSFVRIARGMEPVINLSTFDLVKEVDFRRRLVFYKYKGRQQILRWANPAKPVMVKLDRMMVGDIVQNLLDNACKYSPAKSEIQINVEASRKEVFIRVSDQGNGLPEHVAASLFAEGVRGELASESKSPGLGIGLFMVYRYSMQLGGSVWYEDIEQGGTKFTVSLPREVKS